MDITILVWIAFYALLAIVMAILQVIILIYFGLTLHWVLTFAPTGVIALVVAFMFMYAYGWWHAIKKIICGGASWASR